MLDNTSVSGGQQRHLPAELIERFECPSCGRRALEKDDGLVCEDGHLTPWRDGWLDTGDGPSADEATRRTAKAFGYEWTTFDRIEPEDEQFWDVYFADVPEVAYLDKVALDAGCGMGRYTYFTATKARAIAGLDNSESVLTAARNLSTCSNACVIRSDLRTAPFSSETFEFISCLGVLHHLPDPEAGFRRLVDLLALGGTLLVYVYSKPDAAGIRAAGLSFASALRTVTRRLPGPVVRWIAAAIAIVLYTFVVRPGRWGDRRGIPLAGNALQWYRRKPWRSLWRDTFDRLSAPIEHRYVWSEIEPWYRRAGLDVASVREHSGLIVVARKPS